MTWKFVEIWSLTYRQHMDYELTWIWCARWTKAFLLTHLFQGTLSLLPEDNRKPYGFLMVLGSREMVHWERMG